VIERFNFYDVYGYFVPGLSLLGLIWAPYGILKHSWPSTELGSALAGVVFAYVVGHILQILGTRALPSKIQDKFGNTRYSSDVFLDSDDSTFSEPLKERLAKLVKDNFDIDLAIEKTPKEMNDREFATVSRSRQDAFFLCRGVLIREKIAAYPEQFEGMYTLLRGLATACLLGFAYFVGWTSAICRTRCVTSVGVVLVALALGYCVVRGLVAVFSGSTAPPAGVDKTFLAAFSLAFLGYGHLFGLGYVNATRHAALLAGLAAVSLVLFLRFFTAYKIFAQEFAKAVWRDYAGRGDSAARRSDAAG
jgi:hypothetical protein